MHLDPNLATLAEKLIAVKRGKRNDALRQDLRRRQSEAASRGTLGAGFYATSQMDACTRELEERAEAIWEAYRRVISDARVGWSAPLRDAIIQRIKSEIEADIGYIEEMARDVIVHHGHSFDLFLRNGWPDMLTRIEAEIDLFGLKQQPAPTALAVQLSSPRYVGPALHWSRVQEALAADVPDLIGAAREAIHTVEALAKVLSGLPSDSLGDCIKTLKKNGLLPSAVAKQMETLWGYSSNLETVRHGSATAAVPDAPELLFVVESAEVACRLMLRVDAPAG